MRKTLVLFLDSIRFMDLNLGNTPFIYTLAQKGHSGPLSTLPGYHVEYSIMSGWTPLKHNVWSWYYLNPKKSPYKWLKPFLPLFTVLEKSRVNTFLRPIITYNTCILRILKGHSRLLGVYNLPLDKIVNFSISVDKSFIDQGSMNVPTLFDILRKNNIDYFASEFPTISNSKGVLYQFTKQSDSDKLNLMKKKAAQGYEFLFSHLWDLDSIQHRFGPGHPEALAYLNYLDYEVEKLIHYLRKKGEWDVIIFSDHGFVKIQGVLNVSETLTNMGLKEWTDYLIFPDSTMARIWLKDKSHKQAIKKAFRDLPCKIFDKGNINKIYIPYSRPYTGDILIFADSGYQISPNFFQGNEVAKGMHGYFDHIDELNGIFIINSHKFNNGYKLKQASLVDILPSILDVMGIDPGVKFSGASKLES